MSIFFHYIFAAGIASITNQCGVRSGSNHHHFLGASYAITGADFQIRVKMNILVALLHMLGSDILKLDTSEDCNYCRLNIRSVPTFSPVLN